MRFSISSSLFLLCHLPRSWAWGEVGHKTVATIAQNFLTSDGLAYVQRRLKADETIVSVAVWADIFRKTPAGKFSAPFHFIDAEDEPPQSCNVSYPKRDCNGGCSVSALGNYTTRVQNKTLGDDQINEALKFVIHLLGDITQPLHDEAEAVGGNRIPVTWNGQARNLHGAWDDDMVERHAGGNSSSVISAFATDLTGKIKNGGFANTSQWISCVDITQPTHCALQWATDANFWNCDYVLKTNMTGQELNGTYYDGAVPIIETQIAKGGIRLGYYLNDLAEAAVVSERYEGVAKEL